MDKDDVSKYLGQKCCVKFMWSTGNDKKNQKRARIVTWQQYTQKKFHSDHGLVIKVFKDNDKKPAYFLYLAAVLKKMNSYYCSGIQYR